MGYGEELSKSSGYCHLPHLFPPTHQGSLPEAQGSRSGKPTNNLWWKLEKETNVLIQRIFEMISSKGKLSQLKCQAFKIPKQKTDAMCVQFKTGLGITLLKLSEDTFKRCNSDQNFGEGFFEQTRGYYIHIWLSYGMGVYRMQQIWLLYGPGVSTDFLSDWITDCMRHLAFR